MLDFIYYPVSWIMLVWHWIFSHVTPDSPGGNGAAWALSVVFLVFTLRAILYKPFVKQIRTTKKMQEINPQLQAIRKKYAKDRVKMTEEMQKLQKEHGFNPLLGCLPMLMQIPVFIGLFHVLRSFNRTQGGFGLGDPMTVEQTRSIGNYGFSPELVQNFLDARLFGVPLATFITQPIEQWRAFVSDGLVESIDFTRTNIIVVVIPMMIIASIATHMNSRASVSRQPAASLENPQTRIMNMLALYIFPLGILVTGPFFPVAILLYWMSNNLWTYAQQHIVFGRIEKEEEEARLAKQEKLKANAPKPGARPDKTKRPGAVERKKTDEASADVSSEDTVAEDATAQSSGAVAEATSPPAKPKKLSLRERLRGTADTPEPKDAGHGKTADADAVSTDDASSNSSIGTTPKPGQKPNKGTGAKPSGPKNSGPAKQSGQQRNRSGGKKGSRKGGRH